MGPYLIALWFVFFAASAMIALYIMLRRGSDGIAWAAMTVIGAVGSTGLLPPLDEYEPVASLVGVAGVGLFIAGCFGLRRRNVPTKICYECGYDLRGTINTSSMRCPECGVPLATKYRHCMECDYDLHQTIAGGGIVCPNCRAPIDERFLPERH